MKRPFMGIGISFVIGIIMSFYLEIDVLFSLALFSIIFLIYIYYLNKNKSSLYLLLILFVALGMSISSYKLNKSILIDNIDRPLEIEALVDRVISKNEGQGKYILRVNSIKRNAYHRHIDEKTILKVYGNKDLEIGDRLSFRGVFDLPMENTNPRLYNYRKNLLSKEIFTSINIKPSSIYDLDKADKKLEYKLRIGFRNMLEETFDKHLDKDNSDLMKGIVLGDYSYLDEEYLNTYRSIGLAHILAVSGLHIGILAGAMVFFLSRLGLKRKWNIPITISMIWIYGYLIGFPASILRANIMFSLLFIAGIMSEPYDSINALFLSFLALLIYNPLSIFSLGFQLSYIATFSIISFTPKVREWFYPYDSKLISTISALLGLYIGILAIQIYYFNNFSLMSLVSNILIGPIIFFVLTLAAALVLFGRFIWPLASLLGRIMDISLNLQTFIVAWLDKNNFLNFKFPSPHILEIILYYILVFMIFKMINLDLFKRHINKAIFYYLAVILVLTGIRQAFDQSIQIDFIDVGQGDSALIKARSGNYLIDTGGNMFGEFDIGENITLPYLEKHGVYSLEGLFITHFDLDHCKGLPALAENIDIKRIFISYRDQESEIYDYIMNADLPVTLLADGDTLKIDKNTRIDVISPSNRDLDRGLNANNLSLVLNLFYYDKNILFTGDIEKEIEAYLLDKIDRQVDVLKVAHHGSLTSTTEDFLDLVNPELAIISVGRDNFYGHPHPDVIERLESRDTEVYRTDTMGMIRLILDGDKMELRPFIDGKILSDYFLDIGCILSYYLLAYLIIKKYLILEEELNKSEIQ